MLIAQQQVIYAYSTRANNGATPAERLLIAKRSSTVGMIEVEAYSTCSRTPAQ